MKKIFYSTGVIAFVAALAMGATGAFFSDSETSTGNTFTAGAIDLMVDSTQHYNNAICVVNPSEVVGDYYWQLEPGAEATSPQYPVIGSSCDGTWLPANLGAQKFFNFTDVKPGDEGENTISLHVDSNDAYACADVSITSNDDVSTVDPETDAGDALEDGGNSFDGELAQNLNFFAWADSGTTPGFQGIQDPGEGDNIWQANELPLFSNVIGPASDALDGESYTLADSITGPLAGGSTSFIGLEWCAGTLTAPVPGTLLCDGAGMSNVAQTDSMVATIAFRVEQARNNSDFTCTPPDEEPVEPTVGAALSSYVAPIGETCNVTVDDSVAGPLDTIGEGIAAATAGQTVCVLAGTYPEDVLVNKDITLAGAGAASTFIIGQTSGEAGAVVITADGATVQGFDVIDATGGIAGVRISGAHTGITINSNRIQSVSGQNAFLTDAGQTNHTISNNDFVGNTASQLVYVNGLASINLASNNIDFLNNTFSGSAGIALGQEASNSQIQLNKFSVVTSSYDVEDWEGGNLYNQNNFNDAGLNLLHSENANTGDNGITNAENNWWGDVDPSDGDVSANVDVDFTPFEASAFPQN